MYFCFNDTATTEIYTLSLHDALPICVKEVKNRFGITVNDVVVALCAGGLRQWLLAHDELPEDPLVAMVPVSVRAPEQKRSEEHTSELQSRQYLVCRLLLEKKK